jgi:hypothetical protein
MVTKAKKNPRLTEELLETAKDMRASGILVAAHEKITKRHLGAGLAASTAVALSGKEVTRWFSGRRMASPSFDSTTPTRPIALAGNM